MPTKNTQLKIAILGAGPIGLEAAATAHSLKLPYVLYERGRIGEHVQRWGHCKLFTPFGMNAGPVGLKVLKAGKPAHELPPADALLTGREYAAAYLAPLAETLQPNITLETAVLGVSRRGLLKEDSTGDRGDRPFRLLVRDKKGERFEEADIVLDCTGVYGQHRWLGDGGLPALGEIAVESQISYGLDDVLGDKKTQYANKTILVVGTGYSAATSVCNLAQLAADNQSTWTIWVGRGSASAPMRRIQNDPLKERDRLAAKANNFATRNEGNVEFRNNTVVETIEALPPDKGFKVTTRSAGKTKIFEVEKILANVGGSPDRNLYRELRVEECSATFGLRKVMAGLAESSDAMIPTVPGGEALRNPEPNFFVLGVKSFGRNSSFLLKVGFDQVRDVFGLLG